MGKEIAKSDEKIKNKIHTIRDQQVMLDSDLAELYGIETKTLNRAVKRNIGRFPEHFMFKLTDLESDALWFQNGILEKNEYLRYQNGTSSLGHGGRRNLPHVFTEQGVSMLSGILRSKTAIIVSIQIMDAFVAMRHFISKNVDLFRRLDSIERKHIEYDGKFEEIFDAIESKELIKKQGIFYNGQVFDAHRFISDLIRCAKKSIILVDNYIDDSVLTLFSKKKKDVKITLFTKNISKQLKLDLEKFNSQYGPITLKEFNESHDRFMIIDEKDVYHIGASLKDLGKRWFAFSRFDRKAMEMLDKLGA
ncbi:DNA-binding protein [Candidatus Woesearchaeota archaeon CG11_big_fil_rev_8_21_14_0_20_43_8]|nr:MAG: DNA-binding protein [Candidatus Woesearchaeota archaeon CG11_big_fil_rev_8_21_14_0_20_43_8]PIO06854.1 MAG: DNA-binding protein [Candidatus Woesearchaeota archaeon CG08_land_8_20_14_0_20_43_7]